jgi:hypothetical protein
LEQAFEFARRLLQRPERHSWQSLARGHADDVKLAAAFL